MAPTVQAMEVDVASVLHNLKGKASPPLHEQLTAFQDLYDRKLWHQLTEQVYRFAFSPAAGALLIPLYDGFVTAWESHMNPLRLVQLLILTCRQYADRQDAILRLKTMAIKVKEEKNGEAYILAMMEAAHYQLLAGEVEATKTIMEECENLLDQLPSAADPIVHASYYRVSADYHKLKAEYNQYYKHALLFLACVQLDELTVVERGERAFDLAVAALLGDQLYNFGELLLHPILQSLQGTPNEWLSSLLFTFNAGDLGKFDVLSANFGKIPLLAQNMSFLRQKLCLMSLMELVFKRSGERRLPFTLIGQETRLPGDEVEHLVMKALALKLIRGQLDQVDQVVTVDWVQPRILDKSQIQTMQQRIASWKQQVHALAGTLSSTAPELFVQH